MLEPIKEEGVAAHWLPLQLYRCVYMREEWIRDRVKKQVADPVASLVYSRIIWQIKENLII